MNDLLIARSLMAMSLAFHIVFAALGVGMPLLMAIAEAVWLRTKQPVYLDLCHRWSKGTAILFAVGAVSGTVLSFELGLLWPRFMAYSGAIIGMPFSLEGFAFFTEAIFLGVFLYGWKRVPPAVHMLSGLLVAASGIFSAVFVVTANAWMNAPAGFKFINGRVTDVDPVAAMLNPASFHEVPHTILAAFVATGFLVASVHAFFLLRERDSVFHRAALGIALALACVATPLQLLSGDVSARSVAALQPAKLAAMEAHFRTQSGAPLLVGGIPDETTMTTRFAVTVPRGLSLLVAHDPDARVEGLDKFPKDQWPNVRIVHWSFDIMVGAGTILLALIFWVGCLCVKHRRPPENKWALRGLVAAGPLGFLALEAGWVVTETGRQPWIIYGFMRTRDAVTPMPGLLIPFITFGAVYIFLAVIVVFLLRRQFLEASQSAPEAAHA
jgi:cytochrome bd ubiquinol oxidase subunit I